MKTRDILSALVNVQLSGLYSPFEIEWAQDDVNADLYYFLVGDTNLKGYLNTYMNAHGRISPLFANASFMQSTSVHLFLYYNAQTGDVVSMSCGSGAGKLSLPGIKDSTGFNTIKYSVTEIENACAAFVMAGTIVPSNSQNTAQAQQRWASVYSKSVPEDTVRINLSELNKNSACDCGAHKCGYADDEVWGHAQWCKVNEFYSKNPGGRSE